MATEVDQSGDIEPWLRYDAYKKAAKDRGRTLIVGCLGLLTAISVWAIPAFRKEAPGLTSVGPAWFAIAISAAYFRYYTAQRRFQEEQESSFEGSRGRATGFSDALTHSRREMTKNRLIYGNQFRNADRNGQAAMIRGLYLHNWFPRCYCALGEGPIVAGRFRWCCHCWSSLLRLYFEDVYCGTRFCAIKI